MRLNVIVRKQLYWALLFGLFLVPSKTVAESNEKQIVIAVFDSGIDVTHPKLSPHLWNNPDEIPANGMDDDKNGIIDDIHGVNWRDENGDLYDEHEDSHGTHVSGIALGIHTKRNISNKIKLMFFKNNLADPGDALLKALHYAEEQGVVILNVSMIQPKERLKKSKSEIERFSIEERLGIIPWLEKFYRRYDFIHSKEDFVRWYLQYQIDFSNRWEKAMEKIKKLQDKILIIATVPNNNQNLNDVDFEPATLESPNVISVMNLDRDYKRFEHPTYGSAYGNRKVMVSAVGVNGASYATPKITHYCAKLALDLQREGITLTPQNIKKRLLDSLPFSEELKRYTLTGKYLPED